MSKDITMITALHTIKEPALFSNKYKNNPFLFLL